jgi:hypothetical protein
MKKKSKPKLDWTETNTGHRQVYKLVDEKGRIYARVVVSGWVLDREYQPVNGDYKERGPFFTELESAKEYAEKNLVQT